MEKYKPSEEEIKKFEDISAEKVVAPEQEEIDYSQVLNRVKEMGQNLIKQAEDANAMMRIAKERGVELDEETKKELEKWDAPNEYETQLMMSAAKIGEIKGELYSKGIVVSQEELDRRKQ